jgi:hypothetical protein
MGVQPHPWRFCATAPNLELCMCASRIGRADIEEASHEVDRDSYS